MIFRGAVCTNCLFLLKNISCYQNVRTITMTSAEYCLDSIRKYDHENFLCILLLKQEARSNAIAIRAFNVELSQIVDKVSDIHTGLMRIKFWEDALDKCYSKDVSKIPQHPVATELCKMLTKGKYTKRYFENLISCRKDAFNLNIFPTFEDQEKYCEQAISNVFYLMLEGAGVRNLNADHAASHMGKAQGLVQQLKSLRLADRINAVFLPQDVLIKNQVSFEEVLRRTRSERLNNSVFEIATAAHRHLDKAEDILKDCPKESKEIFLPLVPIRHHLRKLEKCNFDPFHPDLLKTDFWWVLKMWWANRTNKL